MEEELRWLDDEERAAWLAVNALLLRLPPLLDERMQSAGDLTHFEYLVLARLSELPRRSMRISDLAVVSHGSQSRMSHLVKRLEHRGWITRRPGQDDGRAIEAQLTEAGYAKVVATAPAHLAAVRELVIGRLTRAQLSQLTAIGRRITTDPAGG